MSIFGFRTRSAERDQLTDAQRFDRLEKLLGQLAAEISAEKSGLERRYRSTTTDAAFLVEAIENDSVSSRSEERVDDLTSSILACERRLEVLSRQASFIEELKGSLPGFQRS